MTRRILIAFVLVLAIMSSAIETNAGWPDQCRNDCTLTCDESYRNCQRECWLGDETLDWECFWWCEVGLGWCYDQCCWVDGVARPSDPEK